MYRKQLLGRRMLEGLAVSKGTVGTAHVGSIFHHGDKMFIHSQL